MKNSIRRISALVRKEFIDFTRNNNVSIISLLPLLLVIIFGTISKNNPEFPLSGISLLSLGINMNLVFVSTFAISMMIAEEKEKQTLRTLMLSSVKPLEFIISKGVVIFVLSFITNSAIYIFTGLSYNLFAYYVIISIPLAWVMMLIGASIGLIAKNQMSTSVYGMPVILIFMLLPLFASANELMAKIIGFLPNQALIMFLNGQLNSTVQSFPWGEIIKLSIWLIITIVLFIFTFNKRKIDY